MALLGRQKETASAAQVGKCCVSSIRTVRKEQLICLIGSTGFLFALNDFQCECLKALLKLCFYFQGLLVCLFLFSLNKGNFLTQMTEKFRGKFQA